MDHRFLYPRDSPGKNIGVDCHFLLQGIFPTQGSKLHVYVSCIGSWVLYHQHHLGIISTKELMLLYCGVGEDFLRVPWTVRKSNQSILKEINPEYSLEGLILKLKL